MSEFYDIDSTRVSHREYWWGSKSPLVILGWLIKWLRIRLPNSSDDPNVDSTRPFVCEKLPDEVEASFQSLAAELTALGFLEPMYHVIYDAGTRTTIHWATYRHESGKHFARIHHRMWQQVQKADRGLFPMFFTAFTDGTFLVSSAGKPDMAAPKTVQMNRRHRAKTLDLWRDHERLVDSLTEQRMVAPVLSREDLLGAIERHHVLVRDFHLARRVFRHRTASEHAKVEAFSASVARARASGQEHAEVLAELDRLQEQKPGWRTAILVLGVSLVVFLAAGAANWDWKFTLWIIPVLLFHEGGHWVAMRLFHYRNLRMFFIPFFGAAVTGQNWNVAGWKKALVSLAGPVPGIALGAILGALGLLLKQAWLTHAALILLLVNGFNLLPFLPFDGGHVLQATLFSRNRWLDGAFRIAAIVGLILLGVFGGMKLLAYIAIPMAISLPVVFKLGRVADELRRQTLPPPLPGEDRIPPATAQAVITAIRGAFSTKTVMGHKILAQHTLTVFERLNAKPPGPLATIALLALHGGAFLATIIIGMLLIVGQQGGLGGILATALRQPRHSFEPGDIQAWPDRTVPKNTNQTLIIATMKNRATATRTFASFTNQLAESAQLMRFGDSLLLMIPAGDDTLRERWFDEFQGQTTNTFVSLSNSPVVASLMFIAPDKTVATNLTRELNGYFQLTCLIHLIPPWSPETRRPEFVTFRRAREAWTKLEEEATINWRDTALENYNEKITAALKRGSLAEVQRLQKEQEQKVDALQKQASERLRASTAGRIDSALLSLYERSQSPAMTNATVRKAVYRELAGRLGGAAAPGSRAYGVRTGSVHARGLLFEISWLSFDDITQGLPALTDWLAGQGCRRIKYEIETSGWRRDEGDGED